MRSSPEEGYRELGQISRFCPVWLRDAVLEPLEEADIEVQE